LPIVNTFKGFLIMVSFRSDTHKGFFAGLSFLQSILPITVNQSYLLCVCGNHGAVIPFYGGTKDRLAIGAFEI
jgi:hypothetical protein